MSDKQPATGAAKSAPSPAPLTDAERSRKQLNVMLAGTCFVFLSTFVMRRAVTRRIVWAKPTYFRQNMHHPEQNVSSGLEAIEALSVATVNVFSWGIFLTGGIMWATNTSGLVEVKERLRVRLGLSKEEQQDSQDIVGQWIEAAKPWNAFKKQDVESVGSDTKIAGEDSSKTNERGAPPS